MSVAPPVSEDAVFAPVRSQTAFEETGERLGTAIKLGLLAPGTQLPAEREDRPSGPSFKFVGVGRYPAFRFEVLVELFDRMERGESVQTPARK